MNKEDIIKKINAYSAIKQDEANMIKERTEQLIKEYSEMIRSYIPKITDLYYITEALANNNIKNAFMFTDGISHEIGFFQGKLISGDIMHSDTKVICPRNVFGIEGGGCRGRDLRINLNDGTINYMGQRGDDYHLFYLKEIALNFDVWEKSVEQKINKLLEL